MSQPTVGVVQRPPDAVDIGEMARFEAFIGEDLHREGTAPGAPGEAVIVRVDSGPPVINVDGPNGGPCR